jgi:hypothetical protein
VEGFLPIFFLLVVLKIPVLYSFWLIWWAVRAEPELDDAPEAEDDTHGFRRWRRTPKGPRRPRRGGPHGGGAVVLPDCPPSGRARVAPPGKPQPVPSGHEHR